MDAGRRKKVLSWGLGALQAFIGVSAVMGGFGLMSDPSGARMQLDLKWLADSPFPNYWIPGFVLFSIIGFGNLFASLASFFHNRIANPLAIALGGFLILFLMVEVGYVGLKNPLQPLFFILGGIELAMGINVSRFFKTDSETAAEASTHGS